MISPIGQRLLDRWIYVLVKVGPDFLLPYADEASSRILGSREYGEDFGEHLDRWLTLLDQGPWRAGHYFPGKWYRTAGEGGAPGPDVRVGAADLEACYGDEVVVDEKGGWLVGEKRMTGRILKFLQSHLHFDPEVERYWIGYPSTAGVETRYIHHFTPPIRVERVRVQDGSAALHLNTGRDEVLDPGSLWLDGREELYCRVGEHRLPAWFSEPARWELLKDGEEADGRWHIAIGGAAVTVPRITG